MCIAHSHRNNEPYSRTAKKHKIEVSLPIAPTYLHTTHYTQNMVDLPTKLHTQVHTNQATCHHAIIYHTELLFFHFLFPWPGSPIIPPFTTCQGEYRASSTWTEWGRGGFISTSGKCSLDARPGKVSGNWFRSRVAPRKERKDINNNKTRKHDQSFRLPGNSFNFLLTLYIQVLQVVHLYAMQQTEKWRENVIKLFGSER